MKGTHAITPPPIEEKERGKPFISKEFGPVEFGAEPPMSIYEKAKGEPYTIRYFGLRDWLMFLDNPKLDVTHLGDKVRFVENFIINEIKRKNLYDSPESFRKIIGDFKMRLNITPKDRSELVFEKIHSFIKSLKRK